MKSIDAGPGEYSLTGYWDWNMTTPGFHDPVLKSLLGYGEEEFPDDLASWAQRVHPDDLPSIRQDLEQHIATRAAAPLVQDIRLIRKDGSVVCVLFTGKATEWDATGKPAKMAGTHVDITAHKTARQHLVREREFLARTSEMGNTGGWEINLDTDEVTWTAVTRQIFEVPADFVPFRGCMILFCKEGSDRDTLEYAVKEAIRTGQPYDKELRVITAAGREIWARTRGLPQFENGRCTRIYGVIQDVTERRSHLEALRLREEQLRVFVEHTPAAIAMIDKHMRYIATSAVWKASYRLDEQDIIGKTHYEVFPEVPDHWKELHKRCLAGEVLRNDEDSFKRADGRLEWLRWEIRPWYEQPGEVGGMIMFTEVITEKKEATEALILAKEQAEQATQEKTRFLSVMSHEIRTPMNAVIGFTNLLLENPREDQVENLSVLKFSAENLMVLINDILDFNKIEAGKVEFERVDFDIHDLLENIRASHAKLAADKDLELELEVDHTLPSRVNGDPVRIGQIINNLVSNAIKFTHSGMVTIAAELVKEDASSLTIHFEVSDTGIGIPPERQEYIFESFSQAGPDTTRIYGGTGLGLSISKRLLELLGSSIRLKSNPGEGSVFSFDLVVLKPAGELPAPAPASSGVPATDLAGKRILVVEDNQINILVARKFLERWAAVCEFAVNGRVALEMVQKQDYDLVLMDLQMPEMDGYEAAAAIRKLQEEKFHKLPIIALTASVLSDMQHRVFEAGMNDFVSKPFKPEELFKKITKYL